MIRVYKRTSTWAPTSPRYLLLVESPKHSWWFVERDGGWQSGMLRNAKEMAEPRNKKTWELIHG